jgi:hypothetical protein
MYLLLGVAIALVYIILTNKNRQKKQKAKKKQEVPVGRQPIVPYRYSSNRSEQEDQESGMAMLSADKQEALAALAARKPGEEADAVSVVDAVQADAAREADGVLAAESAIGTDALADESAAVAANTAPSAGSVADVAAEAVTPTAPAAVGAPAAAATHAAAEVAPTAPTAAADDAQDTAPIRSFWEAGRVLARLSGQEPQPFSTFAGGTRRYPYCQSALTDPATARTWVAALKPRLNEDLVVFRGTTRWDGEPERTDAEVVIGKSEEPFDVLRLAQTDAPGYDLSTEDIIVKLKSLDKQYGIQLYAAESDAVGFTLDRAPDDVAVLAAELLALCPSAGDLGDSGKLAQHLEETHDIELRWM